MRTTFTINEVISELKEYCIAVCKDSLGFYTPRKLRIVLCRFTI